MPLSPRTLRPSSSFTPRSIPGLALWLDASAAGDLYTTDAGPVVAVTAPTDISGCALWLDASDTASITQSGGLVSQWNDKSGNGRHATASTTARPTSGTRTVNGLNALDFDGTANVVQLTGTAIPTAATHSVFLVYRLDSVSQSRFSTFLSSNPAGDQEIRAEGFGSTAVHFFYSGNAGRYAYSTALGLGPVVYSAREATGSIRSAGASVFSSGSGAATAWVTANMTIGGRAAANFMDGLLCEVVIFSATLSDADTARVEAYLAQRWGISGVHAAATAASDPVGYWRDRSGSDNFTQASSSSRPTVGSLGGKRSVLFDGANDWLEAVAPLSTSMPLTMFLAQRIVAGTSFGMTYAAATGFNVRQTGATSGITVLVPGAGSGTGTSRTGSSDILTITYPASGSNSLSVNGASFALDDTATRPTLTGTHSIGIRRNADGTTNFPANVAVSEIIAYSTALTATQRRRVEQYLASKYGITLAPQVSNADAQDWVNRVYANGGTVSASTASAVNTFCNDIDAAGIRDRFYRMGIFAGTGLNAALVPLYRGPSLGGAQYGNTTDTNNGPFVSGDYAETGASGGLTGNGTSKYLSTGLSVSNIGTFTSGHLSVYHGQSSGTNVNRYYIAANDATTSNRFYLGTDAFSTAQVMAIYGATIAATESLAAQGHGTAGHRILSRTSETSLTHYHNGSVVATNTSSVAGGGSLSTAAIPVFAFNNNGAISRFHNSWIAAYSIGLGMDSTQVAAYRTAMQAFQTALGRNV